MGKAFRILGNSFISNFNNQYIIDKEDIDDSVKRDVIYKKLDISNEEKLRFFLKSLDKGSLFINLMSNVDTVKLRKILIDYPIAYIDTACSIKNGEYSFSKLMEYTNEHVNNKYPYFLGCGLNPGLVELLFIYIVKKFFSQTNEFNVYLYEYDSLQYKNKTDKCPVSWSLQGLIDEFVYSPTARVSNGVFIEENRSPSLETTLQ